MSSAKSANINELVTSHNFETEELPDNLKCAHCKLVLKDACQVPCGCRFCRVCIVDMMARGDECCSGVSEECGKSLLSLFSLDYRANKIVSRLSAKYTQNGCVHECKLANIEDHLRQCQGKSVECPFRELGCKQSILGAEEIDGHVRHEILIANINREIEMLKQQHRESKKKFETMERKLLLKDEQINKILDRMIRVENENQSITREKADLADQVRILTEKIQQEIDERGENDELNMARVIDHIDKEITVVTAMIGSNKHELNEHIKSVKTDIEPINQGAKSIKNDICPIKSQVQSTQAISRLPDAKYDWLINEDNQFPIFGYSQSKSDYFRGAVHAYEYRLTADHYVERSMLDPLVKFTNFFNALRIRFRVYRDHSDVSQLVWPYEGRVIITITDRDRRVTCKSISQQCRFERPSFKYKYGESDEFVFLHSELRTAGLNLNIGLRLLCEIFPARLMTMSRNRLENIHCQ